MGIRVDMSTVLLLLAPLLLPRVYGFIAQAIARMGRKPEVTAATTPRNRSQPGQAIKVSILRKSALPAILVLIYSLYLLSHGKPFNFFSSLGLPIPLIASTSKIQAALNIRNLAGKYEDDLALLTSLDIRALYLHFGHENLIGCHRLLGSIEPKDILIYTSIKLARSYLIRATFLAYSNRRWKNSILLGSVAGFLYEIYTLATTDMRPPQREAAISSLWDFLSRYRNIAFIAASLLTIVLPSKQPAKSLSTEEASLVQGIQALIQRQDMLQTRIRVIEAAISPRVKKDSPGTDSHLSSEHKESLKAWLRTVIDDGPAQARPVPTVKIEEPDVEPVSVAVKIEETKIEAPAEALPVPKVEAVDLVDESFATAHVMLKSSSSEESLSSPALSRSSSSSSPIDTPTPAMRRPMSLEINGVTAATLRGLVGEDDDDDDEDEGDDEDRPLHKRYSLTNRLTQSLGPSGPISHPSLLPATEDSGDRSHKRSFSMYGVIPGIREPEETSTQLANPEVGSEEHSDLSATLDRVLKLDEEVPSPVVASEDRFMDHHRQEADPTMHLKVDTSSPRDSSGSTSSLSQVDDDGWTKVFKRKAKNKLKLLR